VAAAVEAAAVDAPGTTTAATEGPGAAAAAPEAAARNGRQGAAKAAAEDRPIAAVAAADVSEDTLAEAAPAATAPADEAGTATRRFASRASRPKCHVIDLLPRIYPKLFSQYFLMCLPDSIGFDSMSSSVCSVMLCTFGKMRFNTSFS
jgi:hypothetical protein